MKSHGRAGYHRVFFPHTEFGHFSGITGAPDVAAETRYVASGSAVLRLTRTLEAGMGTGPSNQVCILFPSLLETLLKGPLARHINTANFTGG